MKRPSKKELLKIAQESCGVVLYASEKANVSRKTFYAWMTKTPWLKEAMTEARDNLVDLAEKGLIKNIKDGDSRACIYVTSTLGKRRGYTQLIETRDRTKFDDALQDMSDDDLMELLEKTTERIKNG